MFLCAFGTRILNSKTFKEPTDTLKRVVTLKGGFTVELSELDNELQIDYFANKSILASVTFDKFRRQAIFMADQPGIRGFDRMSMILDQHSRSILTMKQGADGKGVTTFDSDGNGIPEKRLTP